MKRLETQRRAICPGCFKQHAVRGDRLVQHGYERPQGWHQNVNECAGTNAPHFGTEGGREFTRGVRRSIESAIVRTEKALAELRSGAVKILTVEEPKMVDGRRVVERGHTVYVDVKIDPSDRRWPDALRTTIARGESSLRALRDDAAFVDKMLASWKPVEPVEVEVERGPTIHLASKRTRSGVACVWNDLRGHGHVHRHSTEDESAVDCAACLKTLTAAKAGQVLRERAETLVESMKTKFGSTVTERFSKAGAEAVREIRYRMPNEDKAVKREACRMIER